MTTFQKYAVIFFFLLALYFIIMFLAVTPSPERNIARRRAFRIALAVAIGLVLNLAVVQGYYLYQLGGIAPAGEVVDGQYFLGWAGRRVRTDRMTFLLGAVHFVVSAPLAFFSPEIARRIFRVLANRWSNKE